MGENCWVGAQAGPCGWGKNGVYWDLTSKLSESSLRCLGGLGLLFWLARSLVESELERDISLPSSVSVANGQQEAV